MQPRPLDLGPALDYVVVDVFTDTPYAGNPLAVVLGAEGLGRGQLQALAREFALSETAFALPPTVPAADYRLRIFTPEVELPFAGHPSVGSAWVLRALGRLGAAESVQECGAGLLPVAVCDRGASLAGGTPSVGDPLDPAPLLSAVGLGRADIADLAGPPPRAAGAGLSFGYLPVRRDAVDRAVPDLAALRRLGLQGGLSVASYDDGLAYARVFAAGVGVAEDPATGSAALGLGVWLVASGLAEGEGGTEYVVAQGVAMGRPSRLRCRVEAAGSRAVRVTVAGEVWSGTGFPDRSQ